MACLFCQIVKGEVEGQKVYEDEEVFAFRDIDPKAPVHILIIPKRHISGVNEMTEADIELIGKLVYTAKQLAEQEDVSKSGYRLVINEGADAGQAVGHVHLHLLGGRKLNWPPG